MILITGGRGAIATHLTALLHGRGLAVRVGSADPSALAVPDGVETVPLALTDPAAFPAALRGVDSVFLYASADHVKEFIDAAAEAGVGHIVLLSSSSVLGPDAHNDPLAASHLLVEEALAAGPIPATFLRPGAFAANAGAWAWAVKAGQPVSLPYPGSYTEPVHEQDVAEAAAAALTEPARHGGRYTLTGPATMTFREQVDLLAGVVGSPIGVREVTREQWKAQMAEYMQARYADALLDLWAASDGVPGEPTGDVQELTGRPARGFEVWAAEHRADFAA